MVQRLKTKVRMLAANKRCQVDNTISCTSNTLSSSESLHSWSNGSLSGHAFQKVLHPCNNVTDYGAAYNRHDLSKCNDLNVLSEFSAASVGESNLETNSKSFGWYFEFCFCFTFFQTSNFCMMYGLNFQKHPIIFLSVFMKSRNHQPKEEK